MSARSLVLAAAVSTMAIPATALAASPRSTLVQHRISYSQENVPTPGLTSGASATFFAPLSWQAVRQTSKRSLSFHATTTGNCRYSITVSTVQAPDADEDATEHVESALPAAASVYLLGSGTRDASAWRVIRVPSAQSGGRIQLRAMLATRRALGTGQRAWHETTVSATSRKGDECHAGTYREVLSKQIGDALATASGRIYAFKRR